MRKNSGILSSKDNIDDEFYTLFEDIAAEIPLYKDQFKNKRIICPCDWDESYDDELVYRSEDEVPGYSLLDLGGAIKEIDVKKTSRKLKDKLDSTKCNFVKFLLAHADVYGFKSLSVSGYNPANGKGVRFQDVDYSKFDLVVTNPPFSQFREFVDVLFKNKLKFLVIAPQNAITYNNVFKHIMNNEMWMGYHYHMSGFTKPDGTVYKKNDAICRCCMWVTNLDVSYRHDRMILTEKYDPKKYPFYFNIDGIDVDKTLSIPCDYPDIMGVPITFLQKYNPDQFEIVGMGQDDLFSPLPERNVPSDRNKLWIAKDGRPDRIPYRRILIKNRGIYHDDH
jgi:hypothetical protein